MLARRRLGLPVLERLRTSGVSRFDVAGFAVKRCLRILPPYVAAVLLFAIAASIALANGIPLPPGMTTTFDWSDVVAELVFFDRNLHHLNASFWSLAVEFRWYIVFPLAIALWNARPRAFALVIVLIILAAEETRASSTDLGVMDAFLLGIIAAHWRVNGNRLARSGPLFIFGGSIIGLVVERSYHFPIQTNFGWHVAAFGLVVYAGRAIWLQRILSNRALVAVGIGSYSIYLVHEPIVSATVRALAPFASPYLAGFVAFSFALAGGAFLWALVERPISNRLLVTRIVANLRHPVARAMESMHLPADFEMRRPSEPKPPNSREAQMSASIPTPV
jgi:peptidoglycan/LPS O-acetylase OafA/YrhL